MYVWRLSKGASPVAFLQFSLNTLWQPETGILILHYAGANCAKGFPADCLCCDVGKLESIKARVPSCDESFYGSAGGQVVKDDVECLTSQKLYLFLVSLC